ncbi:hypothetical protein [Paraburkholderia sp. SIMBA_054]|uniref:hypothetical protein n=1 Tax=Paraburkholderia sp. SIMBA_054 TaxID=3085795 RepID=UPI00397AE6B2
MNLNLQSSRDNKSSETPVQSGARGHGGSIDHRAMCKLLEAGHASDVTSYARSIGYDGKRAVIVLDGKVISHRWKDWFHFCEMCRVRARRRLH